MKKQWLFYPVLLFILAACSHAQTGNTLTIRFAGVPSGTCAPFMLGINNSNGDLYDCTSGSAWNKVSGGGGGSGTVTSIATTAPITGGTITTTGTIACATCATTTAGGPLTLDQVGNPAANTSFTFLATEGITLAGTAPASASSGTAAGTFQTLTAPAGGACTGAACTAGAGGIVSVTTGAGGSAAGASGNSNGGAGGNFNIVLGAGGAKVNSGVVGTAGSMAIQSGVNVASGTNSSAGWAITLLDSGGTRRGGIGVDGSGLYVSGDNSSGIVLNRANGQPVSFGIDKMDISTSGGTISKYNNINTVSGGIPVEYATVDLTAQSAAISATTIYATTATGMYRVCMSADITTAGTSSVLGGAGGYQVLYTSPTDSVVKTTVAAVESSSTGNTTGTAVSYCTTVYAKTGTNIQHQFGYTSTGTTMVYELHAKVEAM